MEKLSQQREQPWQMCRGRRELGSEEDLGRVGRMRLGGNGEPRWVWAGEGRVQV